MEVVETAYWSLGISFVTAPLQVNKVNKQVFVTLFCHHCHLNRAFQYITLAFKTYYEVKFWIAEFHPKVASSFFIDSTFLFFLCIMAEPPHFLT